MDELERHVGIEPMPPPAHRPRWLLPALLTPIGLLVVMNTCAGIFSATLVKRHPALLITLSSQNRWLILASNQLDASTFFVIGFVRLVVADPLFYFLGLFYGDAALRWMERKMGEGATLFLWTERAFKKARYPMVAIAPNNVICLLAGATQMSPPVFIGLNAAGTAVRLVLIRILGKTFSAPIDAVTGFLDRYRWPILAVCVVAFLASTLLKDRGAKGELADLAELRHEAEATTEGEG